MWLYSRLQNGRMGQKKQYTKNATHNFAETIFYSPSSILTQKIGVATNYLLAHGKPFDVLFYGRINNLKNTI
jgi:hypothetical protein